MYQFISLQIYSLNDIQISVSSFSLLWKRYASKSLHYSFNKSVDYCYWDRHVTS